MSEESEDYRAELWADRAPHDWQRCSGCGEEWHIEDEDCCKCETSDD